MDVNDHRGRRAGLGKLLDADREGERVEPGAAVLAGNQDAHKPGFGRRLNRLFRKAVLPIYLGRERLDDPLREFTNGVAKACVLGRKFEVQLRRYLE